MASYDDAVAEIRARAEADPARTIAEIRRDLDDGGGVGAIYVRVLLAEYDRLHTWAGLMSLLDEHYPSDVVDGSSVDPGPRIVTLLRQIERMRAVGDEQRVGVHAGMTNEQLRNFFGDHPFWAPFRELHARIADAGCACTDDDGCRDHELLDRVGSQAEKRLTTGNALFVAAEDALDRLIGGEQARLEQLGRAVYAWRSAAGSPTTTDPLRDGRAAAGISVSPPPTRPLSPAELTYPPVDFASTDPRGGEHHA